MTNFFNILKWRHNKCPIKLISIYTLLIKMWICLKMNSKVNFAFNENHFFRWDIFIRIVFYVLFQNFRHKTSIYIVVSVCRSLIALLSLCVRRSKQEIVKNLHAGQKQNTDDEKKKTKFGKAFGFCNILLHIG